MWYEFKQSILNKACIQKYMETHTKTHRGTLGWVLKVQLVFQIVSWTPFSAPDLLITMLHLAPNIKAFRHMNLCESWLHTYQNCFFFWQNVISMELLVWWVHHMAIWQFPLFGLNYPPSWFPCHMVICTDFHFSSCCGNFICVL